MKPIASNRRAYFDYQILDSLEAGVVLLGPEIKAVRARQVNINGSYIKPVNLGKGCAELWWLGGHFNVDSDKLRTKKLLLHRQEIERWLNKLGTKDYALLPLDLYLSRGRAKLKIGLGKRKKRVNKREELRRRDQQRELEREFFRQRATGKSG